MYNGFPLYFRPVSAFFLPHIMPTPRTPGEVSSFHLVEITLGVAGSCIGDFRETVQVMRGSSLIKECPDGAYAGEWEI